jgi:hypothetical protein
LAATDHQTVDKVQGLLKEVEKDRPADNSIFDPHVPSRMLEELCKVQGRTIEEPGHLKVGNIYGEARFYALRLVHTLNMAVYFNIARDLIIGLRNRDDYPEPRRRPSPSDFLDILHPQCTSSSYRKQQRIASFCKWLLDYFKPRKTASYDVEARFRLAGDLPRKSLVVWPNLPEPMKPEMNPPS